ncbi:MAG: TetR/AcrR family transcriptional regulator [Candidatus Paceibacterota bacterium]|jgi:AcrR family transcriptional regulator|nr:TetR/AcrR family transcriptional regulator [bacterium]
MKKNKEIQNITKDKILEVSGMFFARHGYKGVSLSMIAEKVGIRKASLYYYFKNKEDLYFASVEKMYDELDSEISKLVIRDIDADKKMKGVISTYIDFSIKKEKFIRAVIQNFPSKKKQKKKFDNLVKKREVIIEKIKPVIRDCLKKKANGIDLGMMAYVIMGGINIIMEDIIYSGDKDIVNSRDIANKIFAIIVKK